MGVGLTFLLDYSLPCEQWMTNLWFNIREAALEEMRVRAAARRVRRDDADRLVEEFRRLRERMAGE